MYIIIIIKQKADILFLNFSFITTVKFVEFLTDDTNMS